MQSRRNFIVENRSDDRTGKQMNRDSEPCQFESRRSERTIFPRKQLPCVINKLINRRRVAGENKTRDKTRANNRSERGCRFCRGCFFELEINLGGRRLQLRPSLGGKCRDIPGLRTKSRKFARSRFHLSVPTTSRILNNSSSVKLERSTEKEGTLSGRQPSKDPLQRE